MTRIQNAFLFAVIASLTIIGISSCEKELPEAPTVSLSQAEYTGKTGDELSVTVTVNAPGGLSSLDITKYLGVDIDTDFGTSGTETVSSSSYTLNYQLNAEGVSTPVRFNFTATDNEGQTGSADLIITTEASLNYVLTTYNWQLTSKRGKCLESESESEMIVDCEKDNTYSFNEDGTYTLDFGALTGSGGGTCDFDGFEIPSSWEVSDDESTFTLTKINAFDPNDIRTEVFQIQSYSISSIETTQTVDLTAFGCIVYDWGIDFVAKPK